MTIPSMISAAETRAKMASGSDIVVCAHEDDENFTDMAITGAISLNTLKKMAGTLAREQEIIFYY